MSEAQERYDDLQSRYDDAAEDGSLSSITRRIKDLTDSINGLPDEVKGIRDRGYAYRAYLEDKAEVFKNQWNEIRTEVMTTLQQEVTTLSAAVAAPKALLTSAERQTDNETVFERMAEKAEEAIDELEKAIGAAKERLELVFETLEGDVDSTYSQIQSIKWVLDMKEEASFDFGAAEDVFLAAKAELVLTGRGKKDPDGILYLTNQRLIFEQKERKGGVIGIGSKKEQELEWEASLSAVDSIKVENKGMFGGKDMMYFSLNEGNLREVTIEVKGSADNKFWQKQINRMISGNLEDERAIEPDPEMLEALRNAPTACHVCGATLPRVVAGQTEIKCQYCGTVIRL